ncbi:MAG TPA: hypothetical protein VIH18_23745 [Candidatus Binatia bacterium]|jgi:hypothetical protein
MAHTPKSKSIQSISRHNAEDYMWGIPESPEFSVVHNLMSEFKTHEDDEERWLSFYREIAEESDDPTFRFLLNIIIADEERHNQLLGRMVSSLRDDLASARAERPDQIEARIGTKSRELAVMIDSFLNVERKGIREYERLKKTSQRFRRGLLALLCQTMVYDSLKHIGILNFLRVKLKEEQRRRLKGAPRAR